MRKSFTYLHAEQISSLTDEPQEKNIAGPDRETIEKILKFAASYRANRCSEGLYAEYILN